MKRKAGYQKNQNLIILTVLVLIVSLNGCASYNYARITKNIKEAYLGQPEGYLKAGELPNSVLILPPPPQFGSAAWTNDMEISVKYLNSDDTLRWRQAQADAILEFPYGINAFTRNLKPKVSMETTPYLYLLLQRVVEDASASTYEAKVLYKRQRPFLVNNLPTCDPEAEAFLRNSGSYPSGHSAIGWAWALILTELFPDQANAILQRGRDLGESRVVCNLHWYSDVVEGRTMGAAAVAALHGNRTFQHDLKKAKQELIRIRKQQP